MTSYNADGIGIIGLGNMGAKVARDLENTRVNLPFFAVATDEKWKEYTKRPTNIIRLGTIREIINEAETIIIAVKPKDIDAVLNEIDLYLERPKTLISLCAGISTQYIKNKIKGRVDVIRACTSLISSNVYATSDSIIGGCVVAEDKLTAIMAVHGCMPAFICEFIKALKQGSMACGLSEEMVDDITIMAMKDVAEYLSENQSCEELISKVATKGGITQAGLEYLKDNLFCGTVCGAIKVAREKCVDIENNLLQQK